MRWCVFGLALNLLLASAAYGDEFLFSGRPSADTYQPRIIVPLLTEAFKRVGHSFKAAHDPSLHSLGSSSSGKTGDELRRVYGFHRVPKSKYPNLVKIESELLRIAMGGILMGQRCRRRGPATIRRPPRSHPAGTPGYNFQTRKITEPGTRVLGFNGSRRHSNAGQKKCRICDRRI